MTMVREGASDVVTRTSVLRGRAWICMKICVRVTPVKKCKHATVPTTVGALGALYYNTTRNAFCSRQFWGLLFKADEDAIGGRRSQRIALFLCPSLFDMLPRPIHRTALDLRLLGKAG